MNSEWVHEKMLEEYVDRCVREPIYCPRCKEVRVQDEEELCEACEEEVEKERRDENE